MALQPQNVSWAFKNQAPGEMVKFNFNMKMELSHNPSKLNVKFWLANIYRFKVPVSSLDNN